MGAHGLRSTIPLWVLILASQLPDWADAVVCTTGMRAPLTGMYSHSFAATGALAILATGSSAVMLRKWSSGLVVGAIVVTHTLGDYVTGTKPTWPGGPMIGLQLYSAPGLDFIFETGIIIGAWMLYRLSFPPGRRNDARLLILPVTLIAIQAIADIVLAVTPSLSKC